MFVDELFLRMQGHHRNVAMIYQGKAYHYQELVERVNYYRAWLGEKIKSGDVLQLISDYSPETIAIFIAALLNKAIVVPLTSMPEEVINDYASITQASHQMRVNSAQLAEYQSLPYTGSHPLYQLLKESNHAGLVILSSGSSGKSKAILHDVERLFFDVKPTKRSLSIISFLLFDHIGGLNTLLNSLYSGNTLVIPEERKPQEVANAIEKHHVNVLITSPSFLNLMCLGEIFQQYTFEALTQINYGSEVMPAFLLNKLNALLPHVKLTQSYGMSELGVVPSRSESSTSLKLRFDNTSAQYRIREGKLEIKSEAGMLGYLNSPSPFTEDGWLVTGDVVEQDGDLLRILGRDSEIINVGGEKVFPTEIEEILLKMEEVDDVCVMGEPYGVLGNRILAKIVLNKEMLMSEFLVRMRQFCRQYLPPFKVPQKVQLVNSLDYGKRFKKMRKLVGEI